MKYSNQLSKWREKMDFIVIKVSTSKPPIEILYRILNDAAIDKKRYRMYDGVYRKRLNTMENRGEHIKEEEWRLELDHGFENVVVRLHANYPLCHEVYRNLNMIMRRCESVETLRWLMPSSSGGLTLYLDSHSLGGAGYVITDREGRAATVHVFLPGREMITKVGTVSCQGDRMVHLLEDVKMWRIRTFMLHEFGHVLHQLANPSYYWGLSDCITCRGGLKNDYRVNFYKVPTNNELHRISNENNLNIYTNELSEYGCNNPLDFVAEYFAGHLMGLELSNGALTHYRAFGGPEIESLHGLMTAKLA